MLVTTQIELGVHDLPSNIGTFDENLLPGNSAEEGVSHDTLGHLRERGRGKAQRCSLNGFLEDMSTDLQEAYTILGTSVEFIA